jgi:hypothetical protein
MKVRVRATASVSTRAQTVTYTKPQCSAVLVAGSSSTNRKKAEGLRPREGAIAAVENLSPRSRAVQVRRRAQDNLLSNGASHARTDPQGLQVFGIAHSACSCTPPRRAARE